MCNSKFAQHLLETRHPFGKMEDIMQILHVCKTDTHLNSTEKFYIYRETKIDNQLNDKHTVTYNKIFDTLLNEKHEQPH